MQELDKAAMGGRIREIRLGAKLRQWELAKLLGTTQSAVHKYEHGVVPEPRRLIELARIGGTSIEWVLTGRHWENGSTDQERVSPELLSTACILREIGAEGRASINEALRIVRDAIGALDGDAGATIHGAESLLREHAVGTQRVLESAVRIQRAVLRRVTEEADRRLGRGSAVPGRAAEEDGEGRDGTPRASHS